MDLDLAKYKNKIIIVFNKVDKYENYLNTFTDQTNHISVSALTGKGITKLIESIQNFLIPEEEGETEFSARARHVIALEASYDELSNISTLLTSANPELLAEHYKNSIRYLSRITGEYCTEDLLGDIFSKFCIGK